MRSDRKITLMTIMVLFCCLGGTVGSGSMLSQRNLVAAVVSTQSSAVVEIAPAPSTVEEEVPWIPHAIEGNLRPIAELVEQHNLPPPHRGSVL